MIPPKSATPRPGEPNEAKVDCKNGSSYRRERKGGIDTFDDRPERSIEWQDEIQLPAEVEGGAL